MEQLLPWILKLGSGAIGGNLAGSVLKKFSLGKLGNTLAGVLGGGLGAQLLGMLGLFGGGAEGGALDLTNILGSVAGGTAGGGVVMTVVGMVKNMLGGGSKAE